MPSVRDDVEVALHEHRFLVTKLLESLSIASLPPSTITATRLRTVNETFGKALEKDRELVAAVKKLARHQIAQKELAAIHDEIHQKKHKVIRYAAQLRRSQEDITNVLKKHRVVLQHANLTTKPHVLDPRDVVAYAHRIAGTTSAPRDWRPGFPMFGFMPPAPQPHMMRAGVLSRGIVDAIVTHESSIDKYTSSSRAQDAASSIVDSETLDVPIGLGASDAQIRKQMPAGWNPGDPVDLPLDALLHYMGRSFFLEQGITLPDAWKAGDPLPADALDVVRKKFKLSDKRAPLYDDEVVDDVETLRKRRKLDGKETDDAAMLALSNKDNAVDGGSSASDGSSDGSSDDSDDSDKDDDDAPQKISLSLSSDDDDSESDSDSD